MRCAISEDEEPASARAKLKRRSRSTSWTTRSGAGWSRAWRTCSGWRRAPPATRGPVLGLAAPLRAARRRVPDDPRLRGHAVGGRRPPGLPRVPARLVAQPSALRDRALARPELAESRPTWGAGKRNFTSIYLEPLPPAAMEELLAGLVPGSAGRRARPDPRTRRGRAALRGGDRAHAARPRLLARPGRNVYRPTGEIGALEVPETLHALDRGSARRPPPEERRLLQDGAVLGKTFTSAALAAVASGLGTSSSRCSSRSSARRSSPSRPTRALPSTVSTGSSRTSSARSPTRRSRGRSAAPVTWRRRSTSKPPFPKRRDRRGACITLARCL